MSPRREVKIHTADFATWYNARTQADGRYPTVRDVAGHFKCSLTTATRTINRALEAHAIAGRRTREDAWSK